jgi:glycosyltransferase involved in cell wall biosynthesis
VEGRVLLNIASGIFVPVLAEADVFVRPTNTDGDANSVREALYLGVPAVASDVVERPAGTILFRTRDLDDLEAKVRSVLSVTRRRREAAGQLAPEDRASIETYLGLLARLVG